MSYIPRPNSGTLWPPENKTLDSQPDIKGNVMIEKSLLQALINKSEDPVKVSISCWKRKFKGMDCLYTIVSEPFKASEPYAKPKEPEVPDEDVPF
jgi:hypothetical protein